MEKNSQEATDLLNYSLMRTRAESAEALLRGVETSRDDAIIRAEAAEDRVRELEAANAAHEQTILALRGNLEYVQAERDELKRQLEQAQDSLKKIRTNYAGYSITHQSQYQKVLEDFFLEISRMDKLARKAIEDIEAES